mmetsp:Transcript_6790/g.19661  ORF Transcript_6790/g.19661 Transcript_6790/m.19661 type:complete len:211 (-) Transcript_6790:24-656(-)
MNAPPMIRSLATSASPATRRPSLQPFRSACSRSTTASARRRRPRSPSRTRSPRGGASPSTGTPPRKFSWGGWAWRGASGRGWCTRARTPPMTSSRASTRFSTPARRRASPGMTPRSRSSSTRRRRSGAAGTTAWPATRSSGRAPSSSACSTTASRAWSSGASWTPRMTSAGSFSSTAARPRPPARRTMAPSWRRPTASRRRRLRQPLPRP